MKIKKPGWRVVGTAAAAVSVSIAGLTFAGDQASMSKLPDSINLRDRVPVTEAADSRNSVFEVLPLPIVSSGDSTASFDSPDSTGASFATVSADSFDSPGTQQHGLQSYDSVSMDSPDVAPAPGTAPFWQDDSYDSPEAVAPAQAYPAPAYASYDSPDYSYGSFDSVDSSF